MSFDESAITAAIDRLGPQSHGSPAYAQLKQLLKTAKTAQVLSYLAKTCVREAISWETVGEHVWQNEQTRNANRFPFLQGDVVRTGLVKRLGHSELSVEHRLWLVCAPTCDAVRASFVRVAPIFRVTDDADTEKAKLKIATTLASPKRFPIPRFASDADNIVGYYSDLDEPFYIAREDAGAAVPVTTLTIRGWHLLNILLQENETRANPDEERKIREHVSTQ